MTPEAVIAAIRACGSDPRDLRDAVHEACHALDFDVPEGEWDRETIHSAVLEAERVDIVIAEMKARAVERVVCERLGQPLEDPDHWLMIAAMEMMKGVQISVSLDAWKAGIEGRLKSRETLAMADQVIGLAGSSCP